jgi:hypothetical protein
MATTDLDLDTAVDALQVLEELIERQRRKVRELACRIRPGLTDEQLRNVQAIPEVQSDPTFQFEQGLLAGLVGARIALESRLTGGALPS